jgi:hypothetical protein
MEGTVIDKYVDKDHTLDWEFVGLSKHHNYTDQDIWVFWVYLRNPTPKPRLSRANLNSRSSWVMLRWLR